MARRKKQQPSTPVEVVREETVGPDEKTLVLARDVLPHSLPILPLSNRPFFPRMTVPMVIDEPEMVAMFVAAAESHSKHVGLVLKRAPDEAQEVSPNAAPAAGLHHVGVVAEIQRMAQSANQEIHVLHRPEGRIAVDDVSQVGPL